MFFYYRNATHWLQRQDRVNKEFFNQFKRKTRPLYITSLKRLDGSYTDSDDSKMQSKVSDYSHQLLSYESFIVDGFYKKQVVFFSNKRYTLVLVIISNTKIDGCFGENQKFTILIADLLSIFSHSSNFPAAFLIADLMCICKNNTYSYTISPKF